MLKMSFMKTVHFHYRNSKHGYIPELPEYILPVRFGCKYRGLLIGEISEPCLCTRILVGGKVDACIKCVR